MNGGTLFYGGIALMSIALVGAVISAVILSISKKKLDKQFDSEYGDLKR